MTPHGTVPTPVFMPVATAGAMKGITFDDLTTLGTDIMLCNTYHLHLRPGEEIVAEARAGRKMGHVTFVKLD